MAKIIDLKKSAHDLVKEYPEVKDIMLELGFTEITKPAKLQTLGRVMTIPKGAGMMKIPMETVVKAFEDKGFEVIGTDTVSEGKTETAEAMATPVADEDIRIALLKSYLVRLGQGEDLETVRAEFVENFSDVEASEIMKAEQALIKEGTPISEVQKLCDVHSALFHGATREEQIANAERAVEESLKREQQPSWQEVRAKGKPKEAYTDKQERADQLAKVKGHPLYTFTQENNALAKLINVLKDKLDSGEDVSEELTVLRDISIHYAKKGDLLYPHLKVKYDIIGPSDVMWTVDDEIRDEVSSLAKETALSADRTERLKAVLKRAEEMIYKEQNILFPICAVNFTQEEWYGIYRDSKDYADCFNVSNEIWEEAENVAPAEKQNVDNDEIVMPGGHMTVEQITALFNTIPMEITFVDADNINRFFNEGEKVFKRPGMAIDREVFSCHPPKIEPMVRGIITDFRNGVRDRVPIWMNKGGRTMLVQYMAVRDKDGKYLGTVEFVQDMEFAKEHFESQK